MIRVQAIDASLAEYRTEFLSNSELPARAVTLTGGSNIK